MGLALVSTLGLSIWIIMWATGTKSFDAFMITTVIVLVGAGARILAPYLPGRD